MNPPENLSVTVTYPPAEEPFKDSNENRTETVGQFKTRVLKAFDLTEGQLPDGSTATYTLFHGKTPLENLSETMGAVAGDKKELHLKLSQQLTQG